MNPLDEPAGRTFWEGRLRQYGHTGWADSAIYHYDQRVRLRAVGDLLAAQPSAGRRVALDYGCGIGDFTRLLAQRFEQAVGFDLSAEIIDRARQLNPMPNIRYTAEPAEVLGNAGVAYDLVLSITVLQHVTDDGELQRLIDAIAAALTPGGAVVVLETFAEVEQAAGYMKRRTVGGLGQLFARSGLRLRSDQGFYHPTESPTAMFSRYYDQRRTRLLHRMAGWRIPGAGALLAQVAGRAADRDTAVLEQGGSPTRLLVFERFLPGATT